MHTVGVAYFLVFGSQNDVLSVWCFWRKDETVSKAATTESGAPFVEDLLMLPKDASLPNTREMEEVRPGAYHAAENIQVQVIVHTAQTEA